MKRVVASSRIPLARSIDLAYFKSVLTELSQITTDPDWSQRNALFDRYITTSAQSFKDLTDILTRFFDSRFIRQKGDLFTAHIVDNSAHPETKLFPKISVATSSSPTSDKLFRTTQKMLKRIAAIRLASTRLSTDHHARLLLAYCAAETRTQRKELSNLIKGWEIAVGEEDINVQVQILLQSQMVFRNAPHLLPDMDLPFLSYDIANLWTHCTDDINPMTQSVTRDDLACFFSYLSVIAEFQKVSSGKNSELHRKAKTAGAAVYTTSKNLIKFIESKMNSSALPVDHPSPTTIKGMDAFWRFLVEIESPGRSMFGLMEYSSGDPATTQLILSCSADGSALDFVKHVLATHEYTLGRFGISISSEDGTPLFPSSEFINRGYTPSVSVISAAVQELCVRLNTIKVTHIRFAANWKLVPYMMETPRVADEAGGITTHNGITCAYVKLYDMMMTLTDAEPKSLVEFWYNRGSTRETVIPYPSTPLPKERKDVVETFELLEKSRKELSLTLDDLEPTLPPATLDSARSAISPQKTPHKGRSGAPSFFGNPGQGGYPGWHHIFARDHIADSIRPTVDFLSDDIAMMRSGHADIRRQRVAEKLKTPPDSNGIGMGFSACSCFGCRFNKDLMAAAIEESIQKLPSVAPSSPTRPTGSTPHGSPKRPSPTAASSHVYTTPERNLRDVRLKQYIPVTPGSAAKPSVLDDSFEAYVPTSEPEEERGINDAISELRVELAQMTKDIEILQAAAATAATTAVSTTTVASKQNKTKAKAKPIKSSEELELLQRRKKIQSIVTFLIRLAQARGMTLDPEPDDPSDVLGSISKNLFK